jgi:hypothetical protein
MSLSPDQLRLNEASLQELNRILLNPDNPLISELLEVVERYGGPETINQKAQEAGKLESLLARLKQGQSPYVDDLDWLQKQRESGAFISMPDYRRKILGAEAEQAAFNETNAVTMEISSLGFFPWLITQAKQAIAKQELMPGRYIRVRCMEEQVKDQGDTLAVAAAMQIIGASYVETLDTRGTDGSNIHLGGPETMTGYFGGIGQPNDYTLKWIDEYLHYYTEYGIRQVLNVNAGTVLAGMLLSRLGVDNEFKISVYFGVDNPFGALWTLMLAKLFARPDGSTPLVGFNLANSVNNKTIRRIAWIRHELGLDRAVRLEHHITETSKGIVVQPYLRREELVEIAREIPNIAAKHEGGDPEIEATREHPSNILEYFLSKEQILDQGLMESLEQNYLDKHASLNTTAEALTRAKISMVCAKNLHGA